MATSNLVVEITPRKAASANIKNADGVSDIGSLIDFLTVGKDTIRSAITEITSAVNGFFVIIHKAIAKNPKVRLNLSNNVYLVTPYFIESRKVMPVPIMSPINNRTEKLAPSLICAAAPILKSKVQPSQETEFGLVLCRKMSLM